MLFKKVYTEKSKGNFVRENLKKIASLMKMRSTLKVR